ncbi:MAG TPA: TolC family protein [Burkholderiales bacterium]|nr:TolC family protein [Burkholderiales bacterium]
MSVFCLRAGAILRRLVRLISYLAISLFAHASVNAAATLTFVEAQRIAAERSQQLIAQDASIRSSREMAVAAGQLPDPVLRAGIDNLPIDGSDRFSLSRDFMTMRRIGVMQEFTRPDKRRLRAERFEREADRAGAEKSATLATIQRDTAIAWLEAFYLERLRAAVSEQTQESRLEIEALQGAYRGGRASQAEVLNAQSSRVMLEDRLSELSRRVRNARTMLARWVGDEIANAALVGEPAVDAVPPHARALAHELELHPNIVVMTQEVAMADAEAALARANKRADWTWELAYQKRGSDFSDMVSIGMSLPLQWDQKNRQDRELAAKLALADKARAQREEMLRQHVAEVRAMLNEWENGRERLARYQRELLPLARDRTQVTVSAYRGGKGDLASVLAARRNEIDVRAQTLQLEIDTARVWAQLRFLYPDDGVRRAAHLPTNALEHTPAKIKGPQ